MTSGPVSNNYNATADQPQTTEGRVVYQYNGEVAPAPTRPQEENNIRTINIRQLNHGYVVEVGCQTLAIESSSKLIALFAEYIANPQVAEQKYREGKLI